MQKATALIFPLALDRYPVSCGAYVDSSAVEEASLVELLERDNLMGIWESDVRTDFVFYF